MQPGPGPRAAEPSGRGAHGRTRPGSGFGRRPAQQTNSASYFVLIIKTKIVKITKFRIIIWYSIN